MTPQKEIGECLVTVGDDDYFFRPSFSAMSRIGNPKDIVQVFYDLHNDNQTTILQKGFDTYGFIPPWLMSYASKGIHTKPAILAAMSVMTACCERDVSKLTGEVVPGKSGKWAFVWKKGVMDPVDMIVIAQSLITHGVIGKAKIRQLQRYESANTTPEFNTFDYISAARIHLGMTRSDAEQLTMTEFQLLINAKNPEQKGFTREEYDTVADDYLAKKARRMSAG